MLYNGIKYFIIIYIKKGEIMEICSLINRLIKYALKNSLITEDDVILVRN